MVFYFLVKQPSCALLWPLSAFFFQIVMNDGALKIIYLISIIKMIGEEIWEVKRKLKGREIMDLEDEGCFFRSSSSSHKVCPVAIYTTEARWNNCGLHRRYLNFL